MNNIQVRQQLHHYIDVADDAKMGAIYDIMQNDIKSQKFTPDELKGFYGTLEKYNAGEMPGFSVEAAHNYVRANSFYFI